MELVLERLAAFLDEGDQAMVLGPVRQVRENPYSVTARAHSTKLGRHAHAESLLEYDFYKILDFDPRVEKYAEQRLEIPMRGKGARGRPYRPDVLVKFNAQVLTHLRAYGGDPTRRFRPTVYEVKPTETLREDWDELKPKFIAARRALKGSVFRFRLMTEHQIRPAFAANVRFLVGYKQPPDPSGKFRQELAIDEALNELVRTLAAPITPNEILARFGQSFDVRARAIARLWHHVAHCMFEADLIEPLTMNTPLWPGQMYRGPQSFPTPKWRQPEYDWYR